MFFSESQIGLSYRCRLTNSLSLATVTKKEAVQGQVVPTRVMHPTLTDSLLPRIVAFQSLGDRQRYASC